VIKRLRVKRQGQEKEMGKKDEESGLFSIIFQASAKDKTWQEEDDLVMIELLSEQRQK
jgi:hypothetical protein